MWRPLFGEPGGEGDEPGQRGRGIEEMAKVVVREVSEHGANERGRRVTVGSVSLGGAWRCQRTRGCQINCNGSEHMPSLEKPEGDSLSDGEIITAEAEQSRGVCGAWPRTVLLKELKVMLLGSDEISEMGA